MTIKEEMENIFLFNIYLDKVVNILISEVNSVNKLMKIYHELNAEYFKLGLRTFKNTDSIKREVVYLSIFNKDDDKRYIRFKLSIKGEVEEVVILKGTNVYKIKIGIESELKLENYNEDIYEYVKDYEYIKFKLKDLFNVINKERYLNLGNSGYILNKIDESEIGYNNYNKIKSEYLTRYYKEFSELYKDIFEEDVDNQLFKIRAMKYSSVKHIQDEGLVLMKGGIIYKIKLEGC